MPVDYSKWDALDTEEQPTDASEPFQHDLKSLVRRERLWSARSLLRPVGISCHRTFQNREAM